MPVRAATLTLLMFVAFLGCEDPGELWPDDDDAVGDDDDAVGDDDVSDDDTGDDDAAPDPFRIEGNITIEPVYYILDEEDVWSRQEMEWTDVDPAGYPFGLVYVGITTGFDTSDNPVYHFIPPDVPADPKNESIPYQFSPISWDISTAHVMVTADTYHDGIISYWDDMAFFNEALDTDGEPVLDADIVLDVEFVWDGATWNRGCHMCGGGSWIGDPVVISGTVQLNLHEHVEAEGESLVAVYAWDRGPYWTYRPGTVRGDEPNVPLGWELTVYDSFEASIYGVWDWNNNGLFEPSDDWGAPVDVIGGNTINPWSIGNDPISGITIEVPRAECMPSMPRPYVTVAGEISTDGTFEFGDLPATATLYVLGARHHLPHLDKTPIHNLMDIGKAWSFKEVPGVNTFTTVPYELFVASYQSTIIYALIDVDGDGLVEMAYELTGTGGIYYLDVTSQNVDLDLVMTFDE